MPCNSMKQNRIIDDNTPLKPGRLADATNTSRSTFWRHCTRDGYQMLYGDRSTIGHYLNWLATDYAAKVRARLAAQREMLQLRAGRVELGHSWTSRV